MSGFARASPPGAVLFDLDGTLVDSAPDIAAATNELLAMDDLAPLSVAAVRGMIGQGIEHLTRRAFAARGVTLSAEDLESRTAAGGEIYARRLTDLTALTPGAASAVRTARAAGVPCAVVTNKRESFTRPILAHFGLLAELGAVVCGDMGLAKKPAPDMLLAACDHLGVTPAGAVLVGDSDIDLASARAAGMACVLVRGGYGETPADDLAADLVIDGLSALPAALGLARETAGVP